MTDMGAIGTQGRVTAAIKDGKAGEVMLNLPMGGSQTFTARAFDDNEYAEGEQVWVSEQSGRTVYVVGA